MASLNKVILIGNIANQLELKQTPNGVSVCAFSIGVNRKYTKQGEQPQSNFINIVAWRNTADFLCRYFKKGSAICICGSLQTRSYTAQDGSKRYVTEVVADEVSFVEKKSASDESNAPAFAPSAPEGNFEELAEDSDLPF